mmetsp:Transcript_140628/g.357143  ORF Transcript_140628/g.357143 Transcript_140628/m.357143 type:complete len:1132 (-) Transcript_140628:75-3470(-)
MGDEEDAAKEKGHWPAQIELEKWLMNTAQDADEGATFLRKLLHMNPAYGSYMAGDEALAGIVQVFAKRFRAKILGGSMQKLRDDASAKALYEPLCEVSWRVIGHVLHGIIDLEDAENYAVPKEALGQVKMLLQTNVALSKKFNDMRRAYLRELSIHRDRQRVISEKAQAALNSLQEQPVMFYEPLEFVLDDSTKLFVQEVIEERLKLDMQTPMPVKTEVEPEMPDDDGDPEKAKMYAEMRQLRIAAEKYKALSEKDASECQRAKAQLEKVMTELEQKTAEADELRRQIEGLLRQQADSDDAIRQLKAAGSKEPPPPPVEVKQQVVKEKVIVDNSGQFEGKLKEQQNEINRLLEMIKKLEKEKKDQERELELAKQEIANLESTKTPEPSKKPKKEEPPPKPEPVKKPKKQDNSDLDDLRQQLADALAIEKELRAANKALEKALSESKEKAKYRGPKGDPVNIDEEIEKAIAKITEQHQKQLDKKDAEIERLEALLAKKKEKKEPVPQEEPEKKPKVKKEFVMVEGDGEEKAKEWKRKHDELQEKYDDLEHEYEKLQHQCRLLLDKIKKYGGEEALAEVMREVKITALPPRKKRKKKAWERLYEDAQRRILEMQRRKQELEKQEKKLLFNAASRVHDRKSLRQVENLTHLHKASQATQNRFHDALTRFHQQFAGAPASISEGEEFSGEEAAFQTMMDAAGLDRSLGPAVVATEFHRLRTENSLLSKEVARLRGVLPTDPSQGDASFFGLQTMPLNSIDAIRRAESGQHFGGSMASLTLGLGNSFGSKSALLADAQRGRQHQHLEATSRTPTPTNSSRSPSPQAPTQRRSLPAPDTSPKPTLGALTLKRSESDVGHGYGSRIAQLGGPQLRSPVHSQSPPGSRGETGASSTMPWRQHGSTGGHIATSPKSQTLSTLLQHPSPKAADVPAPRAPSPAQQAQLLGNVPQLQGGATMPWQRQSLGSREASMAPQAPPAGLTAGAPPPGWSPVLNPLPPGQASKQPGPEWAPGVPGRVPSAGSLEPLAGRHPSRSLIPADSSQSPPTTPPTVAGSAAAARGSQGMAATLPPGALDSGGAGLASTVRPSSTLPPAAKTMGGRSTPDLRAAPVKPKAAGMYVTPLRSQQHLASIAASSQQ